MKAKQGHLQAKPMGAPLANQNAKTHGIYSDKKTMLKPEALAEGATIDFGNSLMS